METISDGCRFVVTVSFHDHVSNVDCQQKKFPIKAKS